MSVKHLREYYNDVEKQYREMVDNIHEFEEASMNNLISPEQVEAYKKSLEPIKNNYMTLSWIMYLLNKPNRKSKEDAYNRQTKKIVLNLDKNRSKEAVLKENDNILQRMKELK